MKKRPSILNYGFKAQRLEKLIGLASEMDLELRPVTDEDFECVVENILERDPIKPDQMEETPVARDFEYMLLCDFAPEELNMFLQRSHEEDLNVGYKAGLTETNKKWKLSKLISENIEEHQTMLRINRSRQALEYIADVCSKNPERIDYDLMEKAEPVSDFVANPESAGLKKFYEDYAVFIKAFKAWALKETTGE